MPTVRDALDKALDRLKCAESSVKEAQAYADARRRIAETLAMVDAMDGLRDVEPGQADAVAGVKDVDSLAESILSLTPFCEQGPLSAISIAEGVVLSVHWLGRPRASVLLCRGSARYLAEAILTATREG